MRQKLKIEFLDKSRIGSYDIEELPMDASLRSYARIKCDSKSYILMDCPPLYTPITSFVNIDQLLTSHHLRAPKIFNMDHENGFILMEDFGDVTVKEFILNHQHSTRDTYCKIIDLLIGIQKIDTKTLEEHDTNIMLSGIETYVEWYLNVEGRKESSFMARGDNYLNSWRALLETLPDLGKVVVLRDFHVENLMALDGSSKNIGLLDFQDAMLGHRAYDLVSLLQDARYDVPDDLEAEMINYYLSYHPKIDRNLFLYSYHLLGFQRNSRILGVFNRKALRDNDDKYLKFIPLVQRYLAKNLEFLNVE